MITPEFKEILRKRINRAIQAETCMIEGSKLTLYRIEELPGSTCDQVSARVIASLDEYFAQISKLTETNVVLVAEVAALKASAANDPISEFLNQLNKGRP